MKNIVYDAIRGTSNCFQLKLNEEKQITELRHGEDPHQMNWVRGKYQWGTILCDLDLSVKVARELTDQNTLVETYTFYNETEFDIYVLGTQIGICTPLPDYYRDASFCLTQCCNTHIWCGESSSYIMALRMGGIPPHLGLVLRDGGLKGYSVERMASVNGRQEELSNHRGDFILHPENFHLRPGESYCLKWELFWFKDKAEFREKLRSVPDFIDIEAKRHVLFENEAIEFDVALPLAKSGQIEVLREGKPIPFIEENGKIKVWEQPEHTGEYVYRVKICGKTTKASFLVKSRLEALAEKRCRFIEQHQQCQEEKSFLHGAYLIFDNEEKQQYYGHLNDHNGGRERIGMGILMALYLRKRSDEGLQKSLERYTEYVLEQLFDESTGEVFNDAGRCRDYIRLYNYPWMSRFFLELFHLTGDERFLDRYYKSVEFFYHAGGTHFYAIGMPMQESIEVFQRLGRKSEAEELLSYYEAHGAYILSCGKNYPPHEVDYEQSIVAPAAIYMCELYHLTGKEEYRAAAVEQLAVLDLFQGFQPDYHMNEVAIRHWDGYWFGKRRCLGDTYPHYWSALSGYAYSRARGIRGAEKFAEKAEKTLRAVLSLIHEDGSASCAMVYPMKVNGKSAAFYDPWANDQDWGLYYAMKLLG